MFGIFVGADFVTPEFAVIEAVKLQVYFLLGYLNPND